MRAWPSAVWILLAAASARAVTFTQITECCTPQEFGATQPAWSPDGDKIAVTFANDYLLYELWVTIVVLSPTGTSLFEPGANFLGNAAWAPDASRYVCQRGDGLWVPPLGLVVFEAWDPSGAFFELTSGNHAYPAWSPDGATIAFADLTDDSIWRIPATGGTATLVAQGGTQPAWTSDGDRIVYTHAGDLWVIPAVGGAPLQLTQGPAHDHQPTCSPNGLWIAFVSDRNGNNDLFVMPIDGGTAVPITNDPALDQHPSWAPGSDRIAFESTRSGHLNIWIASDLPDFTIGIEPRTWGSLKSSYR